VFSHPEFNGFLTDVAEESGMDVELMIQSTTNPDSASNVLMERVVNEKTPERRIWYG